MTDPVRWFYSLRIRTQVSIQVATAFCALLGIGLLYLVTDSLVQAAERSEQAYGRLAGLNDDLDLQTLEMRRAEKDFLLHKRLTHADRHDVSAARAEAILQQLADLDAAAPMAARLQDMADGLAAYRTQFALVAAIVQEQGLTEADGLRAALRYAAHDVEAMLLAAGDDDLLIKLLMMRRHEKDFMLRGGDGYVRQIDERLGEFLDILEQRDMPAERKTGIIVSVGSYLAHFGGYVDNANRLAAEQAELSRIFARMQPDRLAIDQAAESGAAAAGRMLAGTRRLAGFALPVGVVLMMALVVMQSVLLVRGLTQPILKISRAMQALTRGDTSVDLAASGGSREIAQMAATIDVFKQVMIDREQVLAREALTDALTGLANRRAFQDAAERAWADAARRGETLSLALLDVDHFKQVNDRYGHQAGDAVLKSLALTASESVRGGDLLARVGGEEFAVLMPRASNAAAVQAMERLRCRLAARPALADGDRIFFTVSVGIATASAVDGAAAGVSALIREADRALYAAKHAGRNQVRAA